MVLLGRGEQGKVRESKREREPERKWGYVDYQSDGEQWENNDVPKSPQLAAEDTKAQEGPGQGLLLLQ